MELQKKRQTYGDFGGGHGQNEQEHYLSVGTSPAIAPGNKRQAACVQHDLDAHQGEDQITPRQKSDQTQREQGRRQTQHVFYRYRHCIAPPL
jgi:hypothetical protein